MDTNEPARETRVILFANTPTRTRLLLKIRLCKANHPRFARKSGDKFKARFAARLRVPVFPAPMFRANSSLTVDKITLVSQRASESSGHIRGSLLFIFIRKS